MDSLSLVERGQTRAVIIVPVDATPQILDTAHDLSDILARISGATLPIITEPGDGPTLVLGTQIRDRSLPPPAYHVWREDDRVYFSGGSDCGVVNGVYAFLEEELGCRWYTPDPLGEYIPKLPTISVCDLDMRDAPDYESVGGFGRYSDDDAARAWKRRNRLDGFPPQFYGHNWSGIVPPELVGERPELFALVGKRRNRRQFCTTHPDSLSMAVAAARKWFDDNPETQTFSLSPGDFRGFCQCERCRALDAEIGVDPFVPGGSMTDRLVHFFNRVAEQVVKTHPNKRLAFYAYMTYTRPPEVVKLHPMLRPVLVHTPWDYCMHHAIDDSDCERNRPFAEFVRAWSTLSPDFGHRDYWGHWAIWGPVGMVHTIRRDLPWMNRHGSVGMYAEGREQWWTQALNLYLPLKLAWDVDADVDAIVAEFYERMFGPAASAVAAYDRLFEDAMEGIPKDRHRDRDGAYLALLTPAFFERAGELLDGAGIALGNAYLPDVEAKKATIRLKRYRYGLRIAALQAAEKQDRRAGRMRRVIDRLNEQLVLLDEIEADPDLTRMIDAAFARRLVRSELMRLPKYHEIWERSIPELDRRAELERMFDDGNTRAVARALGYWTDWYLVGLWPNDEGDLLDTPYPPEQGVNLDETFDAWNGKTNWRLHRSESPYGIVDLERFFFPEDTEYTVAYAYTTIDARRDADVRLDVTCDDDIVLWLNDDLVFAGGAVTGNFDIHVGAHLRAGENRVLAKVLNKPHAFNFSVRIADETGRPHDAVVWEQTMHRVNDSR